MPVVAFPNGQEAEFPDTMAPEAIDRAMREYAAKNPDVLNANMGPVPRDPVPGEWAGTKSAIRGTGRGIAQMGDIPLSVLNWGAHKSGLLPETTNLPGYHAAVNSFDQAAPRPIKGYETTERVSEIAGPAVIQGIATMGASVPESIALAATEGGLGAAARTAATQIPAAVLLGGAKGAGQAGLGVAGTEVGRDVGSFVGGETGGDIGGALGGLASTKVPQVSRVLTEIPRRVYMGPDAPARVAMFDRQGVPLSMGAIGNPTAAVAEDATTNISFLRSPARTAREGQFAAIDQLARRVANRIRNPGGAPVDPGPGNIGPETVGNQTRRAAQNAGVAIDQSIGRLNQGLENRVGAMTPVGDFPVLRELRRQVRDPTLDVEQSQMAQDWAERLQGNRTRPNSPVMNPALAQQHVAQQAIIDQMPTTTPAEIAAQQAAQAQLNRAVDMNRASTFGASSKFETKVGKAMVAGGPAMEHVQQGNVRDINRAARRRAAIGQGVPGPEFDNVISETRRMAEQGRRMDAIPQENAPAFNDVFGKTGAADPRDIQILREHVPNEVSPLLGNAFELKVRGEGAGDVNPSPMTVVPARINKALSNMGPDETMNYANGDPVIVRDINDLRDISRADVARPTRAKPRGGNSFSAPITQIAAPAALAALAKGESNLKDAGIGAILPGLYGWTKGKLMTSDAITRAVATPQPWTALPAAQDLPMILARAAAGQRFEDRR